MITLFLIALVPTALFFASVPVVVLALMIETCTRRAVQQEAKLTCASTRRLVVSPAHAVSAQAA
jgi:hypothetical protein